MSYHGGIPFEDDYNRAFKPWKQPLKRWRVEDTQGLVHEIEAHFAFNNGEQGLVFRAYPHKHTKTTVVAAFAHGAWRAFKESIDG